MELFYIIIYFMNKFFFDLSVDIVKLLVVERLIEGVVGDDVERGLVERRVGVLIRSDVVLEVGFCNK